MKPILKFSLLFFLQAVPGLAYSHPAQWTLDLPDSELPSSASPDPIFDENDLRNGFPKEAPGVGWDSYFKSHASLRNLNLGIQMKGTHPLSRRAATPMLPASVEKVLTAAAALKYLGPDARFENFFIADQDVVQGFVKNVRFKVSGDPTWANESFEGAMDASTENLNLRLQKVIDALKARDVKQVRGPIAVESLRPGLADLNRPEGWRESWNLECMAVMQTEFQANGNCGDFKITSLSRYGWVTSGVSVPVVMKVQKSREGVNSVQPHPVFDSHGRIIQYVFTGHLAKGPIHFELPVHQSGEWLKNLFVQMLKEAGIEYQPNPQEVFFPLAATPIEVDLSSRPLIEILRQAVQYSINGVMDRIFLEVGFQKGGAPAPIAAADAVLGMMRERFNDETLMSGIVVQDGSGLNLLDRMRPDSLYRFLELVRSEPYFSDLFSTLAIAGKAGTLLNRSTLVASSYTYSKIFAKTGTLNGVTNLAGYFWPSETATPEPFVVFTDSEVSPVAARPMVDGIVVNFAAQNSRKK